MEKSLPFFAGTFERFVDADIFMLKTGYSRNKSLEVDLEPDTYLYKNKAGEILKVCRWFSGDWVVQELEK